MGREVRKVRADWVHPMEYNHHRGKDCLRPMFDTPYSVAFDGWRKEEMPEWLRHYDQWQLGMVWSYVKEAYAPIDWSEMREEGRGKPILTYVDYAGVCPSSPDPANYMPDWPEAERTHFMMYETTSEGTPISPAFTTPEELARWLADTGASSFGSDTASYESWLRVCNGGYACSAVMQDGRLMSGVEGLTT